MFFASRAFANPMSVFVKVGSHVEYKTWDDLIPFRGGISLGDRFGGNFDSFLEKKLKVEVALSMKDNFRMLSSGMIDYFVTGHYAGLSYLNNTGLSRAVVPIGPYVTTNDIYFAFSRKSSCLRWLLVLDERMKALDGIRANTRLLEEYKSRTVEVVTP